MSSLPLVTIGLPVYNGMPLLREAMESLLNQDYPNLEIVISDNASTDGTGEYCRELAKTHPRVRYARNLENIGPAKNFGLAAKRARGPYFMWAANDDKWNPQFVSALVAKLEANPAAVLATPAGIHIHQDGSLCNDLPDRAATGNSQMANLKLLYDDHAITWLYGLWRMNWLQKHVEEYYAYPIWGADVLWLADICLRSTIVGNEEAVIYKRYGRSSFAPKTARAAVAFWIYMFWYLAQTSFRRNRDLKPRLHTLALSARYVYQLGIRRPNLPRTLWRVIRMVTLAAITSPPMALVHLWRTRTQPKALGHATA